MLDVLDTVLVRELVAGLPPRQREIAELLMAGHDQRSAARALGISVRTARTRMRRIRRRMA